MKIWTCWRLPRVAKEPSRCAGILPRRAENASVLRRYYPSVRKVPLAKPEVCILIFSNTGYSRRMRTHVSFSAPHILHEGVFARLIVCSMYCRLIRSVRSPTNILQCFLSSLLMNQIYLLVDPSKHNCPVPYFSQTLHSVCYLFSIQLLILDFNVPKDSGRKGSGPIGSVLASSLVSLSAVSRSAKFRYAQLPALWLITRFTSDRTVSFSIESLQTAILFQWLLGLQFLLGYQCRLRSASSPVFFLGT